jgi:uncharacterized protein with NAD-binding domain and iron-sulfur cluster
VSASLWAAPASVICPGEHGFRFFPGFYRHLPDTMSRIPYGTRTVAGNLVESTRILVARAGLPSLELLARLPQAPTDWVLALHDLFSGIGVPDDEVLYFVDRLLLLMTSCPERPPGRIRKDFVVGVHRRGGALENLSDAAGARTDALAGRCARGRGQYAIGRLHPVATALRHSVAARLRPAAHRADQRRLADTLGKVSRPAGSCLA